jgi:hypothetical protein
MNKTYRRALVVATIVLVGGIVASLAGNLQAINLGDAQPGIGAYVSAVLWPLFLFGAIEVMLHTPWVSSWRDGLTKWAGLLGVAFVSFWISYWHMAHVLHSYGYDSVSSHAGPLAVDITMAMATLALNRVGQARRAPEPEARPVQVTLAAEAQNYVDTMADAGHYLDRLAGELTAETTTAFPLDIVPVSPAPAGVKPESVPADAADLILAWAGANPWERPRKGVVDALVALELGVAPRTARRWRDALVPKDAQD